MYTARWCATSWRERKYLTTETQRHREENTEKRKRDGKAHGPPPAGFPLFLSLFPLCLSLCLCVSVVSLLHVLRHHRRPFHALPRRRVIERQVRRVKQRP